jgi:hypothetical protein
MVIARPGRQITDWTWHTDLSSVRNVSILVEERVPVTTQAHESICRLDNYTALVILDRNLHILIVVHEALETRLLAVLLAERGSTTLEKLIVELVTDVRGGTKVVAHSGM